MLKLSEDARKYVLTSAASEARRRGDRRLGTDHLLLGLLNDEDSPVARALGVSLADARAASEALDLAALAAVGIEIQALGEGRESAGSFGRKFPPMTSGTRTVFKHAVDLARPSRTGRIDSTHFLLALLLLQRPDPAAELLTALRIDPEAVRKRLADAAAA